MAPPPRTAIRAAIPSASGCTARAPTGPGRRPPRARCRRPGTPLPPAPVDITGGSLTDALRGCGAVAACIPYRLNLPVMEAALAAGCGYADLGGLFHTTLRQWELHDRFAAAGIPAILGIGSAPGITNV